jgi:hypothetical protein
VATLQLGKEVWERVRISARTVVQPPIDTYSVKEWWSAPSGICPSNREEQLRPYTFTLMGTSAKSVIHRFSMVVSR